MSPEPPPPDLTAPPEPSELMTSPPEPRLPEFDASPQSPPPAAPESYPFWGYPDLAAFVVIALFAMIADQLLAAGFLRIVHVKPIFVMLPAQFLLYGFLLWTLSVIFRRYYGRPFWQSLRWAPTGVRASFLAASGVVAALVVMLASVLLRTPDINSPMKELLSDKASVMLLAVFGTTLAPLCEELLFRGFLQPLLVRSLGAVPGVLSAAAAFGLLHLQEYGYSWRHGLLITLAGAAFGWMRHRTGSTKAAVVMHAAYNFVFFMLLAAQQAALHGR